jgi:hypothetical protein
VLKSDVVTYFINMAKSSQTQARAFRIGGISLILIGIILLVTLPLLAILTPILLVVGGCHMEHCRRDKALQM